MSSRSRRALIGLAVAVTALAALPASALAAGEALSFNLSGTQAGSNPNITTTLTFAPSSAPKTVVLHNAPGLLANLNANPSCITGAQQLTSSCQVGSATISTNLGTANGNLYLVPPAAGSNDFAGLVTHAPPLPDQYTGASLRTGPTVGVDLTTNFPQVPFVTIASVSDTLNSTLNSVPFTHLPTSCGTNSNTMDVAYYGGASGSTTGTFDTTGCSNLPYAPKLTASIAKDTSGNGATLVMGITQAVGESASKSITLTLPRGLTPNVGADVPCLTGTGPGCKVGTATATSAGVPSAALANGTVTLSGTATTPTVTIAFPAPFAISITGTLSLATNSVTFANVPDVPLTSLTLNITGPNGQKAFNTDCKPASVAGSFTPQSGTPAVSVTAPIAFTGCAGKPTASGSTAGLASGHPKLKFKITHGNGAPNVSSVAIALPGGLKFSRSALVSHRTCTTKPKKKCTTTTLISGLGISGAKAKSVAIKGGKLVITLKKAAAKFTITVSGPLVAETAGLQSKVKHHKTKTLKFTLKVTDAKKTATTLSLKLKAH